MNFLIIKPSTKSYGNSKNFEEVPVKSISNPEVFIQQQVGTIATPRKVGDYLLWISDPIEEAHDEVGEIFDGTRDLVNGDLPANLLVNEFELAYGNVVVTSNYKVTNQKFAGLNTQDIANIMNAFTKSNSLLVEQKNRQVPVDSVVDAHLAPNGLNNGYYDEPFIDDLGYSKSENYENTRVSDYTYTDEVFEEPFVAYDTGKGIRDALENENLQDELRNL